MWRLQVKTYAVNNSSGHTFYVMAADGSAPDRERVNKACLDIGGKLVHPGAGACPTWFCGPDCEPLTSTGQVATCYDNGLCIILGGRYLPDIFLWSMGATAVSSSCR